MDKLIALDDGHGMDTPGKRSPALEDGTVMRENEFNSAVVDLLKFDLKRCGFEVILVAPTDTDISLEERVYKANENNANIFISVHANAFGSDWGSAKGIETYHYPTSVEGRKLGNIVHRYLMMGTPFVDRGVKTANFYVLKYTKMPAILVECGFMTNKEDLKFLLTGAYRRECAREIAKGVCEYYGVDYVKEKDPDKYVNEEYKNCKDFVKELDGLINKYDII